MGERARLLRRIILTDNSYIKVVAETASTIEGSWAQIACEGIRPWCPEVLPSTASGWQGVINAWAKDTRTTDAEETARECSQHHNLANYCQVDWEYAGLWRVNRFLHSNDIPPEQSRLVNRMLVAGQDLRGGDPAGGILPSRLNCCVFCLERGRKESETLQHVVMECQSYMDLRTTEPMSEAIPQRDMGILILHRDRWTWRHLKQLRRFFLHILNRRAALVGSQGRKARITLQDRADAAWWD